MNNILLIVCIVLGLVLLTLEIVALPGLVAGIFGLALLAFGIWESYMMYGSTFGTIILLICIVICFLLLVLFMKTKTWKRFSLNEQSDSKVNQIEDPALKVGARGVTVARLAPTGKALIDGKLYEVHALNKFIDQDKAIEVIAIEGYRIDVCETSDERF